MEETKFYSAQDIEKLKQKIAIYRDALTALKTENAVDDNLFTKSEWNHFKKQVSNLEGAMETMDDKQSVQMEAYAQQINSVSMQIGTLNETVEQLNHELTEIVNKLQENENEQLLDKIDPSVVIEDSLQFANENVEGMEDTIGVKAQTNDVTMVTAVRTTSRPPSFTQLKHLAQQATISQEDSGDVTLPKNAYFQERNIEEVQANRRSFPSIGTAPSPLYTSHVRTVDVREAIHQNWNIPRQRISVKVNEVSINSGFPSTNQSGKNEMVKENADKLIDSVPIEKEPNETLKENINTLIDSIPIEKEPNETLKESVNTVIDSVPIEKEPNEALNETEQQENTKQPLSLFKIFRRKS